MFSVIPAVEQLHFCYRIYRMKNGHSAVIAVRSQRAADAVSLLTTVYLLQNYTQQVFKMTFDVKELNHVAATQLHYIKILN